ncbi:3687_t:CDS:2 [Entrophospora sp. SA101]|nr:3687_t:CDS:2 [Entrophospora sp. SA101]
MDADQRTENLKTLLSMFPDVDSEICEAVLASNDNDLETSINTLLIEYVEEHRSTQQHRRQQQQQEEEDQSSPFSDFTEELPVIKEKIVQAADSKSSPLRSQQPVYGSYEIDLDKKKDSYSPFKIIEKDNDLITISSSSNINNNNIKSDMFNEKLNITTTKSSSTSSSSTNNATTSSDDNNENKSPSSNTNVEDIKKDSEV